MLTAPQAQPADTGGAGVATRQQDTEPRESASQQAYLKHVHIFVMCVLHHHSLIPRQRVGYAVLTFAADSLVVK